MSMTYNQWLEEAQRAADVHAVHFGRTAQYTDVAHILYRRAFEQDRWPTFEAAVNDAWGTALPVPGPPEPPPVPETGLVGTLRLTEQGFADDTGLVVPRFIHDGDWFGRWVRDRVSTENQARTAKAAGWQGGRAWDALGSIYWESKDRDVSPLHPIYGGERYWREWDAFVAFCASINWRILVSHGDINALADTWEGRLEVARRFAQSAAPYPWVYATFDGANEGYVTGEYDMNRLSSFVQAYRDAGGTALLTLTSPDAPTKAEMTRTSQPPADLYEVEHGDTRTPLHWWDKLRHVFSSHREGKPDHLEFGIQSEPVGPDDPDDGIIISVTENLHEIDAETVGLLAAMAAVARQIWVFMSGEGVYTTEGIETEDGFYSTPQLLQMLPQDMMSYQRTTHIGDGEIGRRGLSSTEPDVRVDSRVHDDGRVVSVAYGPSGTHTFTAERGWAGYVWRYIGGMGGWVGTSESWAAGETVLLNWYRGVVLIGRYAA